MIYLNKITFYLIILAALPFAVQSDNIDEANILLDRAIVSIQMNEDSSIRDELLKAAYELDPESPHINWQMLWSSNWELRGEGKISSRATGLARLTPDINRVKKLAMQRNELALFHYIQSRYLSAYRQLDKAIAEIDKALLIEPTSTRFLFVKASILATRGNWEQEEVDVWRKQSVELIEYILSADLKPSKHINQHSLYFNLAYYESHLKKPDYNKVVTYYLKSLEGKDTGVKEHFVWNNMSIAYFKMGRCQEAFDAAKKAIDVSMQNQQQKGRRYGGFGAAETNLRNANYCLEMQKMGIL